MSLQSQYGGKCPDCGAAWKVGDDIYKEIGWNHWCHNPRCTQGDKAAPKPAPQPAPTPAPVGAPAWKQLHAEVWPYALSEAKRIYGEATPARDTYILAQVIYKSCMAAATNGRDED